MIIFPWLGYYPTWAFLSTVSVMDWKQESCHDANFVVSDDKVGIMTTLDFQCDCARHLNSSQVCGRKFGRKFGHWCSNTWNAWRKKAWRHTTRQWTVHRWTIMKLIRISTIWGIIVYTCTSSILSEFTNVIKKKWGCWAFHSNKNIGFIIDKSILYTSFSQWIYSVITAYNQYDIFYF